MRADRVVPGFSGESDAVRFSFWKPEPLPPKNAAIVPIELVSLGNLDSVAAKLLDIPRMSHVPSAPWEAPMNEKVRLHWGCEAGVWLSVAVEQGPLNPGEILTIEAQSKTPEKTFFKLYVQIFEQLGVTVLDERIHEFFTPREFKTRLAG
ncbi:MAG: hypothetical protein WCT04_16055 [Planctomycetota bacterium]